MKIALICPHFPPDHCGVGDHTFQLARELTRQGQEVRVWTAQEKPVPLEGITTESVPKRWNFKKRIQIAGQIQTWGADRILVQYVPHLYSSGAWDQPLWMPFWIAQLKRVAPVGVMVHELHYPLGLSPDRILIGIPQFTLFQSLALIADHVFFSYELPYQRYCHRFPWRSSHYSWLPVGANIDPATITYPPESQQGELLQKLRIAENHRILLQFGKGHQTTLFGHSFAALEVATKKLGQAVLLIFLGIDEDKVEIQLRIGKKIHLKPQIRITGYLEEWQVSALLNRSDLVLAPLIDGVSTRRTSIMAALAHGKPVITTLDYGTDPSVHWEKFCVATSADHPSHFAELTSELLENKDRALKLGILGKQKYEHDFNWPTLVRKLITKLL